MTKNAPSIPVVLTDLHLVDAISRLLAADGDIDASAVHVTADHGTVQLRGKVGSHSERLAIARIAEGAPGARGVENCLVVHDLAVPDAELTDEQIASGVGKAVLDSTVRVDGFAFDVRQHVVTIRGDVGSGHDRVAVRHCVERVAGVHFVRNELTIKGSPAGPPIEELEPADCFKLLGRSGIGRLAVHDEGGIDIFPVNYLVHDGTIYFRSGPGAKMTRVTAAPQVAFEADGRSRGRWWSVVVQGVAARLDRDDEIASSGIDHATTAHPSEKLNYVRIHAERISGRRFRGRR